VRLFLIQFQAFSKSLALSRGDCPGVLGSKSSIFLNSSTGVSASSSTITGFPFLIHCRIVSVSFSLCSGVLLGAVSISCIGAGRKSSPSSTVTSLLRSQFRTFSIAPALSSTDWFGIFGSN